jgi:hypothetical protein
MSQSNREPRKSLQPVTESGSYFRQSILMTLGSGDGGVCSFPTRKPSWASRKFLSNFAASHGHEFQDCK